MKKRNLKSEMILNKKFENELSGYNVTEVDQFLDLIIEDYKSFEIGIEENNKQIQSLKEEINEKNEKLATFKLENNNLKTQSIKMKNSE